MARRTQVSFTSFNLYNLHIPGERIYRDSNGWTQEEYDKKLNWGANILKSLKSRVWGFQELWHEDALEDLFERADMKGDYDLLVPPDHSGKKIVCAAAVKKGDLVGEPNWEKDFHDKFILHSGGGLDDQAPSISVNLNKFSRKILNFQVQPKDESEPIDVFVAHLKSKRPTVLSNESWFEGDKTFYKKHSEALGYAVSTIRRTAEAAALRMYIVEKLKDTDNPLVVLGDLNDGQLSNTLNILTGQPNYLMGLSTGGSDTDLYSVTTLEEYRSLRDVYYTHIYQNIKESLDHILVSQEFYDNSKKRVWAFKGMEIVNDHLNNDEHKELGTGDHGIVKATFEYRPA